MQRIQAAVLASLVIAVASCGQAELTEEPQNPAASTAETNDPATISTTWSLDPVASKIAFASIKGGEVIETHYFPGLSGEVSADGNAVVSIPLDQVETKIDLRNERMREMFFETGTYPTATIRAEVDATAFKDLPVGGRKQTEIEGVLALHGSEAPMFVDAFVTRIASNRIEIASSEPVIVHVADFDLEHGLEALREVAGLPAITAAVPVTFTFVFDAKV